MSNTLTVKLFLNEYAVLFMIIELLLFNSISIWIDNSILEDFIKIK